MKKSSLVVDPCGGIATALCLTASRNCNPTTGPTSALHLPCLRLGDQPLRGELLPGHQEGRAALAPLTRLSRKQAALSVEDGPLSIVDPS